MLEGTHLKGPVETGGGGGERSLEGSSVFSQTNPGAGGAPLHEHEQRLRNCAVVGKYNLVNPNFS